MIARLFAVFLLLFVSGIQERANRAYRPTWKASSCDAKGRCLAGFVCSEAEPLRHHVGADELRHGRNAVRRRLRRAGGKIRDTAAVAAPPAAPRRTAPPPVPATTATSSVKEDWDAVRERLLPPGRRCMNCGACGRACPGSAARPTCVDGNVPGRLSAKTASTAAG